MEISLDHIASFATTVAVVLAAWQIREARRQAQTQFEDGLSREYRDIIQNLPTEALLGKDVGSEIFGPLFDDFYRYIDLSNEQVFLRQKGRVSRRAWLNWRSGMASNFAKPSFARAWVAVQERAGEDQFKELRHLDGSNFAGDPRWWALQDALRIVWTKS